MANNNISNEYDDVVLVRFFKSIHCRYSPKTLWVINSCLKSRFIDNFGVNLKGLLKLHEYLKQQMQLYVATKSKTFRTKEIYPILTSFQEKNEIKATLLGVAIALLYYSLLRATEVQIIQMEYVQVENISSQRIIEVMFKHEHKLRNEGFQYYIPSKFYPMFARYLEGICQDIVAAGNLQFLKNWNKVGKRRVQNTSKKNVNIVHVVICKISKKVKTDTPAIAGGIPRQQTLQTQGCPSST